MNNSKQYDVAVCGGGFSGVAAACAAAREGCSVLLIEKYGFFGGMATSALVNPFMNYSLRDGSGYVLNRGLFTRILDGLESMGGLHKNRVTFNETVLKLVMDKLICEFGVDVLFHTKVIGVSAQQRMINYITVSNCDGISNISAKRYVDASGNGDVSAMSGCDFNIGRDTDGLCQPMTLCFRLSGVNFDKTPEKKEINILYNEFQKMGKIKNKRENILTFINMNDGVLHFNSTRIIGKSPVCADDLTKAEFEGREQMLELYTFLHENVSGFENSQLLSCAAETGIRESRRITGHYVLCEDDILSCKKFDDSIARGNYDIDIHNPSGTGTTIKAIPDNEYYTIPYRCLVPKDIDNLIVSGRPISSTHEAHSSYRVMPICCNIGEAAGIAAALSQQRNNLFVDVNTDNIRRTLSNNGGLY